MLTPVSSASTGVPCSEACGWFVRTYVRQVTAAELPRAVNADQQGDRTGAMYRYTRGFMDRYSRRTVKISSLTGTSAWFTRLSAVEAPMAEDSPPTIYDVARIAGVSHQTVSRVLNAPETVRPANRTRVLAVIAYLGYTRNAEAVRLGRRGKPATNAG
jgi:hypothetical protein